MMDEEIKYIDELPKRIDEDLEKQETITKQDTSSQEDKKVTLPTWNIEPPLEIQRNLK